MQNARKKLIVLLCLQMLIFPAAGIHAAEPLTVSLGGMETADDAALSEFYEAGELSDRDLPTDYEEIGFGEAIRLALEKNLELEAASYGARAATATQRSAYGLYDPVLSVGFVSGEDRDLLNLSFFSSPTENDYQESSVSVLQRLPIGTELSLTGQLREEEAVPAPTINPSFDSKASLSLVQPLLKGFGTTYTGQNIIYASKDKEIELQVLRQKAFDVVAAVRNAYLQTLQARYELSYRETSVELARRIVQENAARVEAGILAPVEKLEAEVGLQARERLLLDARRAFADELDVFNSLLNAKDVVHLPVIQSFEMEFRTDEEAGIESGLMKRPDVLQRMKGIERIRTERSIARSDLLPELNLVASYSQNGLGDTSGDSLDVLKDGDYDSWEVGLEFSYPLGSVESRNAFKRTEVLLRQERALLAQLHNDIRREVRSAIRNLDVSRKKTEVARRGHDLASEKLRILLKSRDVGLATTRDVLDGEEDLASARTDQITSIADYFKAITEYRRVTGTLLESEGVILEEDLDPDMDESPFLVK